MNLPLTEKLRAALPLSEARGRERYAAGASLTEILEELLIAVEQETGGGMLASILLLDPEGKRLLHGAAPSLPEEYNAAIHGLEIGPGVGSCGTAAYLGHPVYVTDIASDPLWANFKDLAMRHGLRACWSTPFEGEDGRVLGTFAVYHTSPRTPTQDELAAINMISRTVAAAVARQRRRSVS
jgi:GAF domain-containing protein